MPLYYLHICDGEGFVQDEEGQEFPDEEAARAEAFRSARSLMMDEIGRGKLNLASFIEVESEGEHLFTLTFKDAVTIEG